jgi:hypothetical protein
MPFNVTPALLEVIVKGQVGKVVPIPTLPALSIRILSVPLDSDGCVKKEIGPPCQL